MPTVECEWSPVESVILFESDEWDLMPTELILARRCFLKRSQDTSWVSGILRIC